MEDKNNQYIETGVFVGTHGVKGELRLSPWSDSPDFLLAFDTLYINSINEEKQIIKIKSSRIHKRIVLIEIENINTIDEAESLRNKIVYIKRDNIKLKDGDYLIIDLIGCEVFDNDTHEKYGTISDVSKTGANDVWHIKADNKKEYLIPSIPDVVNEVDIKNKKILITPLKGIFDED